jgi:hypothetical protein
MGFRTFACAVRVAQSQLGLGILDSQPDFTAKKDIYHVKYRYRVKNTKYGAPYGY